MCALSLIIAAALHELSPAEVDTYLEGLRKETDSFEARVTRIARDSIGTAYADGPLGEGPEGKYDTDPLIDLSRADCVTYVEQVLALAVSESYDETVSNLQAIRYKDGMVDFATRNHFMLVDWVGRNAFATDVTANVGVDVEEVTRTVGREKFFSLMEAPELAESAHDETVTRTYIPVAKVPQIADALPSPSLICFVGNVDWLFALHCGLYVQTADENGILYHASAKAGKVTSTDLASYVASQRDRYKGITVHALSEPCFKGSSREATLDRE